MASMPANAETSISSVDLGRWKLVMQRIDHPEAIAGRDEDVGFARAGTQLA